MEGQRSSHLEWKMEKPQGFKHTHQALPLHAHVIGRDIDAGGSVSDALSQADIETIAGGSAGQLALLVHTHCKISQGDGGLILKT